MHCFKAKTKDRLKFNSQAVFLFSILRLIINLFIIKVVELELRLNKVEEFKTPKNLTALLSFFTLVTASKIINENHYQNTGIGSVSL